MRLQWAEAQRTDKDLSEKFKKTWNPPHDERVAQDGVLEKLVEPEHKKPRWVPWIPAGHASRTLEWKMVFPSASRRHLRSPPELFGHVGAAGAAGLLAHHENGRETLGRRLFDLHQISQASHETRAGGRKANELPPMGRSYDRLRGCFATPRRPWKPVHVDVLLLFMSRRVAGTDAKSECPRSSARVCALYISLGHHPEDVAI